MGNAQSGSSDKRHYTGRVPSVDAILRRYSAFHSVYGDDFFTHPSGAVMSALNELSDLRLEGSTMTCGIRRTHDARGRPILQIGEFRKTSTEARNCVRMTHDEQGRSLLGSRVLPLIHYLGISSAPTKKGVFELVDSSFSTMRVLRGCGYTTEPFIARLIYLTMASYKPSLWYVLRSGAGYPRLHLRGSMNTVVWMIHRMMTHVRKDFLDAYAKTTEDTRNSFRWPLGEAILANSKQFFSVLVLCLQRGNREEIEDNPEVLKIYQYLMSRAISELQVRELTNRPPGGALYLAGWPDSVLPATAVLSVGLASMGVRRSVPLVERMYDKIWPHFCFDVDDSLDFETMTDVDGECSICLGGVDEETGPLCLLPCSPKDGDPHCFHRSCILTWIKTQRNCPLCRNQVPIEVCKMRPHFTDDKLSFDVEYRQFTSYLYDRLIKVCAPVYTTAGVNTW